jgi:hypothetical protein
LKPHKKIYYVGGMISLIPIVFWIYVKPTYDDLNLRILDFGLPYKVKKGEKPPSYAIIPIEGYNYLKINLSAHFDEKTEKQYFDKIKSLQEKNIDKTGIKFQLSDQNSYGDIVRLINLMLKTDQDAWGLDTEITNSFYVVHRKKNESKLQYDFNICGGVINDYINQNEYEFKHSTFFKKVIKYFPQKILYLIIGYLVIVCFSVNRLLKFNRKNYR